MAECKHRWTNTLTHIGYQCLDCNRLVSYSEVIQKGYKQAPKPGFKADSKRIDL